MTLEEACNSVRLYVEAKEFNSSNSMGEWSWLDRLDDCLADIRADLAEAAQDDGKWSRYLDMTSPSPQMKTHGWKDEYSALSDDQRVMLQQLADQFGVPLIAAFHRAKELGQLEQPAPPPPINMSGVQELLNSLDRKAIALIVDPSAWKNEGGDMIEQVHSDHALRTADQIITYVLFTARALAATATEGSADA